MKNLLSEICANKRLEVARQKDAMPLAYLKELIDDAPPRQKRSLRAALLASPPGIIAEFKRRSPSKGDIRPDADVESVVRAYEAAGAAAISCLTDERFFGGGFADFDRARAAITRAPLLRKDFIIDEYQLYQSKVMGADAVLLIAACLAPHDLVRFAAIARELDMETLLEIHDERELSCVPLAGADVMGINNRDLRTFNTNLQHTIALARQLPAGTVAISESGLSEPETVATLYLSGLRGFLIGEHFMRQPSPGSALQEFIHHTSHLIHHEHEN
jgi:indole-3-glycerol phosphate synthase